MASFIIIIIVVSYLCFFLSSTAIAVSDDADNFLAFTSTLPNLETLSNWQSGENPCLFAGVFCSSVTSPSHVTSLDLSFLPISSDFASVVTHLFVLDELVSLKVTSAKISGALRPYTACSFSPSLIDLSVNSLSGSPSDFSVFSVCAALTSLNLSTNFIDSTARSFSSSSKYSLGVQTLDVSDNRLTCTGFLPWILSTGCAHLSYLPLRMNKLAGVFSLKGCDKLQHFDVYLNNFSSPMPVLGACKQLVHLDLSSNKFNGEIGDELVACEKLSFMNFFNNQFSVPII